jgi:small conductance mechanosensitive channel
VSDFVVSSVGSVILTRAAAIAVTLAVIVTILQLTRIGNVYLLRETAGRTVTQKMKTLIPMIRAGATVAVVFVGGIVILGQVGVDTTPILAGAGIVGLAVGFGSQTLVKDLINGLFILFEESIRVGDWAQIGDKDGTVEAVGLRTVRLRDLRGNVHVIPNSSIDTLTNFSKEYARSLVDIGVAYREDVDEVIALMQEVADGMQKDAEFGRDILGPITMLGLDRFDDSAVVIRAFFTTRPLTQWRIRREFHLRIKRVFDERGIEIPFPHRTVYMGEPKQGKAPPVHVRMDDPPRKEENGDTSPALPASRVPEGTGEE